MSETIRILLVAPTAPPKNSPEAIQVGRFLEQLDPSIAVTLLTTPATDGWERKDETLACDRTPMDVIDVSLPFHRLTHRVFTNYRLQFLHVPDSECWLGWRLNQVMSRLTTPPDVIYSRSCPFSAAVLAGQLAKQLQVPWLMHLSDPWVDSPYRSLSGRNATRDARLEAWAFENADRITLTTEGQAAHYRRKYPHRANTISVTPNMSSVTGKSAKKERGSSDPRLLKILYTGALYGDRNPSGLLRALDRLSASSPNCAASVSIEFVGNMSREMAATISASPQCTVLGPRSFRQVSRMQRDADLLLTIEPEATGPLARHMLLSKTVDYLSAERPILALTPLGSVTHNFCEEGYGWAFEPDDEVSISRFLDNALTTPVVRDWKSPGPPDELQPARVTRSIEILLRSMAVKA